MEDYHRTGVACEKCEGSVIATASTELFMQCRDALAALGSVDVVTHHSSLEALVSDTPPVLIIVDINLPDLSAVRGIEALLRRDLTCKMLVITERPDDETALALLRAGASGYCPAANVRKELLKACRVVLDGEVWAERRIVSRLLNEMRAGNGKKVEEAVAVEEKLTPRERDITKLVTEGMCQKSIAGYLGISENTVRNHLRNIFGKTGVSSRLQLALLLKGG